MAAFRYGGPVPQNAPLPDKKIKKISGEGAQPLPQTPPHWRGGYPLPRPYPPLRLRRLDSRAFGARHSRSFSFTTRTLFLKLKYCNVKKRNVLLTESVMFIRRFLSSRCATKTVYSQETN